MKLISIILAGYLLPSLAQALPMELKRGDNGSGEVYLDAIFDGHAMPIKFDTGADGTQLLLGSWNQGYPSLRQIQRGGASGVRYTCDVIRFANASVDGLALEHYETQRCDLGKGEQLFSLDFFAQHVLSLKFSGAALLIDEPEARAEYPLRTYPEGHKALAVAIDGRPAYGVFDTGAGLTSVDQRYVDENPQSFEFIKDISDGTDGGGNKVVMKLYRMRSLEIAGVRFEGENVLAFEFSGGLREYFGSDTPLILGFNVITKHDWILDLRNGRWSLVDPK